MVKAPAFLLVITHLSALTGAAADENTGGSVPAAEVQEHLADTLEGFLGGAGELWERISRLNKELKPLYDALPQDQDGRLDAATTRYALHRHFQGRGWLVQGLAHGVHRSRGQEDRTSSSTSAGLPANQVLREGVFDYINDIFAENLGKAAVGVVELSILVTVFELLASTEVSQRLRTVFASRTAAGSGGAAAAGGAEALLRSYARRFLSAPGELSHAERAAWREAEPLVRSLAREQQNTTFAALLPLVGAFDRSFASRWVTGECARTKKELLAREQPSGSGVASLGQLGSGAVDEVAELRRLGALDESRQEPLVIVANYLQSPAMCVGGINSSLYRVCCPNECYGLLARLEYALQAPAAPADFVVDVAEELLEPKRLSKDLTHRLQAIASAHEDLVPIHGRAFAEWMHHAFPHACAKPGESSQVALRQDWIENYANENYQVMIDKDGSVVGLDSSADDDSFGEAEQGIVETVTLFLAAPEAAATAEASVLRPRLASILGAVSALAAAGAMTAHAVGMASRARKAVGLASNKIV